jgi:hypothetical protein
MSTLPNSWTSRLSVELATFEDRSSALLAPQKAAFDLCDALLKEDSLARTDKSGALRYARRRARNFLVDVYQQLGSDAFLLCALAIPITHISREQPKQTFSGYRDWWASVSHPPGLRQLSDQLCKGISFSHLSLKEKRSLGENSEGYFSNWCDYRQLTVFQAQQRKEAGNLA